MTYAIEKTPNQTTTETQATAPVTEFHRESQFLGGNSDAALNPV